MRNEVLWTGDFGVYRVPAEYADALIGDRGRLDRSCPVTAKALAWVAEQEAARRAEIERRMGAGA